MGHVLLSNNQQQVHFASRCNLQADDSDHVNTFLLSARNGYQHLCVLVSSAIETDNRPEAESPGYLVLIIIPLRPIFGPEGVCKLLIVIALAAD